MSKVLNGFSADTPQNLQLDAGVFLKNVDLESATTDALLRTALEAAMIDKTKKIGATSGGGSFSVTPEFMNIAENLDGARMKIKGLMRITNVEVMLTTTIKEITKDNLALSMAATTVSVQNGSLLKPRFNLELTDYLENIVWVGTMTGSDNLLVIVMENVLNTSGMTISFEDKGTGSIEVQFEPFVDLADMENIPVKLGVLPPKA